MFQMLGQDWEFLWSLEHTFACASTTNQAEQRSSATHLLASQDHKRTTAWWSRAQRGGPYSRHPLQAQAPLNPSVMTCHSLERTQADPLCLSENLINLISQHARQSNLAEKLPSRPGFEPGPARVLSPSGQQALWPIQWSSPLSHRDRQNLITMKHGLRTIMLNLIEAKPWNQSVQTSEGKDRIHCYRQFQE